MYCLFDRFMAIMDENIDQKKSEDSKEDCENGRFIIGNNI